MTSSQPIDLERLLSDRLAEASPDLLRGLLSAFIHALMDAEADAICAASYRQRSGERTNSRNGYRHRDSTPVRGPSTSRFPGCVRAAIFRTGCWSCANAPSGR